MVLEDVTNTAQPRGRNHHQQQQRVAGGGGATHQPAPTSRMVGAIMAFSFWKTTFRPTQAMEARMTEWAAEANADMEFALIPGVGGYSDRFVLCLKKAGPGQITLSRGCETVRARIGTTALPTRLTFGRPFLERLLSKVVQHESRVPEPVWTKGGAFTAAAMRRILSVNSRLLDRENQFENLVEAGDMTLLDIPTVNHAREIVAREKDELAFASRPELNGKLRLTFRLPIQDPPSPAPSDSEDEEPLTLKRPSLVMPSDSEDDEPAPSHLPVPPPLLVSLPLSPPTPPTPGVPDEMPAHEAVTAALETFLLGSSVGAEVEVGGDEFAEAAGMVDAIVERLADPPTPSAPSAPSPPRKRKNEEKSRERKAGKGASSKLKRR
ncbi:hypothetical protein CAPTEDRAFT_222764 [Capitella teleta]|uniref:Uncharacterized protein n=1 Tax=Capitella teleta TaxID=283909 RepID=R7TED1_CAPTE|nr:hypothetical protein CAPTEDRAFT_222764 [Capitella teleta]|eukprot:ELT89827.1 hypothetical protein CAPTEDRAFT_222764 [Capitella teleta]